MLQSTHAYAKLPASDAQRVVFEEFPGRQFVNGIAVDGPFMAAWFRDSEGNLLNVRSKASRQAEEYGRR